LNEGATVFDVNVVANPNGKKKRVQVIGTLRTAAGDVLDEKPNVCDAENEKEPWEDEFELDMKSYVKGRISNENMRLICEGNTTWIARELASNFDALRVDIDKQLAAAAAGLVGGYAGVYRGVTATTIGAGGSGYTSAPTIVFSDPQIAGGTTATGTVNLTGDEVTSITITDAGSGYTSAPTITFSGGGGTGATATATLAALDSSAAANMRTYQLLEANAALNFSEWADMEMMLEDNQYGSRPIIVGQTNALMHKAVKAQAISCCNQDGYDMGAVDGLNFYKSRNITTALGGANRVLAFNPGYLKAVFNPLNVGEFRKDTETYKEMTITDPISGLTFDLVMNYVICNDDDNYWQYTIGTQYGLYALPADKIYATNDYLYNSNKVLEFAVSQAS
jgi:hypothetical protein